MCCRISLRKLLASHSNLLASVYSYKWTETEDAAILPEDDSECGEGEEQLLAVVI